jgi:3-hydroxyacyl-CoA dehydrogenase/3a,7a,12a-trihydroxy-5b-cholest-24-enoyl-CoA hydratase
VPTSGDIFAGIGAVPREAPRAGRIKTARCSSSSSKNPDASVWTIDLCKGNSVGQGETATPECTLEISDADFMDMCTGKADPHEAVHGRQAEDRRQPHGQSEARLPQEA